MSSRLGGPGRIVSLAVACTMLVSIASRGLVFAADPPAPAPIAPPPSSPPTPPPASIDVPPPPGPVEFGTLPEITVTAPTFQERALSETTPALNVMTRQRLTEEMPAAFSDITQYQPGLWSTQGSASQGMGTLVIRGSLGNQVLQVFDGIRLNHDRTPTGPGPDWELIDMDLIDHVEVLRSPDSVLYGTGAVGGVAGIYTRIPVDFTDGGCWTWGGRLKTTYAAGGINMWRSRAEGYFATPTVRAVLGVSVMHADEMEAAGREGTLIPSAFDTQGGDFRMEWRPNCCNTYGLSFFGSEKTWDGDFLHPARVQQNWFDREIGILRWQNDAATNLWDGFEVRMGGVHTGRFLHRTDKLNYDDYDDWTIQLTAVAHKQCGCGHRLTYGLDFHDEIDDSRLLTAAGLYKSPPYGWILYAGAFAQDEWDITRRLRLTAGVRFDAVWAKTDPKAATTNPLINPDDIRLDRSDTAWTGKLGLLYHANDCLSITGDLSRGYRFPSLTDLAGFRPAPDEIDVGVPSVKPEYSTCLEAGVHWKSPCWRANLAGYYTWYEDLIVRPFGSFNGMTWIDRNGDNIQNLDERIVITSNAGKAEFRGIEGDLQVSLNPCWTAFGYFTIWDGEVHPDPTEPTGIPNNATVGVRYQPSDRFWAQCAAHMVSKFSKIPQGLYDAEAFFLNDPQDETSGTLTNDHSMPAFTVVELRAGARLGCGVNLTVGIDNLFNEQFRGFGDRHDGPGRTFVASLSVDF